jgi:hypothetical protein
MTDNRIILSLAILGRRRASTDASRPASEAQGKCHLPNGEERPVASFSHFPRVCKQLYLRRGPKIVPRSVY